MPQWHPFLLVCVFLDGHFKHTTNYRLGGHDMWLYIVVVLISNGHKAV
ncbi:hypothetical protein F0Z19_3011 [Vibrio cyclitrophicus]|nr:hypothetical protein M565_ctg1P0888 [Vibrio cyclitrophicus FF75]KAA8598865.1 hypothetical protein F0Z19_3011 [Vibrio cyclitrophicus]